MLRGIAALGCRLYVFIFLQSKRRIKWNNTFYLLPLYYTGVLIRYWLVFCCIVMYCLIISYSVLFPIRLLIVILGLLLCLTCFAVSVLFNKSTR